MLVHCFISGVGQGYSEAWESSETPCSFRNREQLDRKVTSLQKRINEHRPTGSQCTRKWLQPYTNLLEYAKNWTVVVNSVPTGVSQVSEILQHAATHSLSSWQEKQRKRELRLDDAYEGMTSRTVITSWCPGDCS